jgi:hypothetical protein
MNQFVIIRYRTTTVETYEAVVARNIRDEAVFVGKVKK